MAATGAATGSVTGSSPEPRYLLEQAHEATLTVLPTQILSYSIWTGIGQGRETCSPSDIVRLQLP